MRHDITDDIRKAIASKIPEGRGGAPTVARQFGLTVSTLYHILDGRRSVVMDDIWNRLCLIAPEIGSPASEVAPLVSPVDLYRLRVMDRLGASSLPAEVVAQVMRILQEAR